jgi:hypothetical protein
MAFDGYLDQELKKLGGVRVPQTGKIAVKMINHYGDEVMKVYDC